MLLLVEDDLMQLGSCLENFGLPKLNRSAILVQNPQVIQDELYNTSYQKAKSLEKLSCLNSEQQQAHEMILHSVLKNGAGRQIFFINAPGGYGKTFLLETILLSVSVFGQNSSCCCIFRDCCRAVGRWKNSSFPIQDPNTNI